jgi:tryptophan synthase beta subunit
MVLNKMVRSLFFDKIISQKHKISKWKISIIMEGILTALETAHAFAAAKKWAFKNQGKRILIGNSGRGDKDMVTLSEHIRGF